MTRFYLKLIIPIVLVCLTFTLITRAIGTTQPPNPALRGFVEGCEDKPQPCWYGIVPGMTTVEEAKNLLLRFNPEQLDCIKFGDSETVILEINVYFCIHLTIGELILHLGNVSKVYINPKWDVALPSLQFEEGYVEALWIPGVLDYRDYRHSPFDSATVLSFYPKPSDYPAFEWHGFISLGHYCPLEPDFPYCELLR